MIDTRSSLVPVLVPAYPAHEDSCHCAPSFGYGTDGKAVSIQRISMESGFEFVAHCFMTTPLASTFIILSQCAAG